MKLAGLFAFAVICTVPTLVSAQPFCPGQRLSIYTPPLSSEPYVALTVGNLTGPFLIDYGATQSSLEGTLWNIETGPVDMTGPALPGLPPSNRFLVSNRNMTQQGVGRQHGVIGTDLLSKMVVELRYENANDEHLVVSSRCDTSGLAARGFWRFGQRGFFSARSPPGQLLPNVPVLHIDFQKGWGGAALGAKTWAQIDPGFGDPVRPYSIDVNEAYLAQLKARQVPLVEVDSVVLNDCMNTPRTDRVYVVPGHMLRLEDETGKVMYRQSSFHVVLKGKGAPQCGGIAHMVVPAAQFGASFLRLLGRTIFDPFNEAVWILPTLFSDLGGPRSSALDQFMNASL